MLQKLKRGFHKPAVYVCAVLTVATGGYFTVVHALGSASSSAAQPVVVTPPIKVTKLLSPSVKPTASPSLQPAHSQTSVYTASKQKVTAPRFTGKTLYTSSELATITATLTINLSASDTTTLNKLASQPTAKWFGAWSGDIQGAVNNYVSSAASAGSIPVMVAYNIPFRDCGGQSAGGASTTASYSTWIQGFANGIAGRQAIVILEPDSVAADCFSSDRAAMLSQAVQTLQSAGASVYLDGGNPTWHSASDMANRLKQAGIDRAAGFSLNVSNFQTTGSNISYGNSLAALVGGKHFVIDTSRNGNGSSSDYAWCNPGGRALGIAPTTSTGQALVDAYLWIKVPGESDGTCGPPINGIYPPSAGTFWREYALMLARNAGW